MKLITNTISSTNHFARFSHYTKLSDEIILMSPFLAHDLSTILEGTTITKLRRLTLITCLDTDVYKLSKKLNFLISLHRLCNLTETFSIKIDNKLH